MSAELQCDKPGTTRKHRDKRTKDRCPYCKTNNKKSLKNDKTLSNPAFSTMVTKTQTINKQDIENGIKNLNTSAWRNTRKSWDALLDHCMDNPRGYHVPGVGMVTIEQKYDSIRDEYDVDGFGNVQASMVYKIKNGDNEQYFRRYGLENSYNGTVWNYSPDEDGYDNRLYSDNYAGGDNESDFYTEEVKPRQKIITVYD